jgi:hypothetical protein
VRPDRLHAFLLAELDGLRGADGGFPVSVAGASEVEPTVVAALALRDARARAWLVPRQRPDGGFAELDGRVAGPTTSALAALALDAPRARRALAHAIAGRGLPLPNADDPKRRVAWGWTSDTRSLTEPTARVLLAVNARTPDDRATRAEALGLLADRQCADGGWNFGNASVYDVDLKSYPQTTAVALIALQGAAHGLVGPALRYLADAWRLEPGGLTLAQTVLALRLHGAALAAPLEAFRRLVTRTVGTSRPLALAWGALATGPEALLEPLRSRA